MAAYVLVNWGVTAAILLFFSALLGVKTGQGVFGILIDSRNKMSLSRFQVYLWTLLLVSIILAVAISEQSMSIAVAPELWALLGISVGSTASALILRDIPRSKGKLHVKPSPPVNDEDKPSWLDLFRGDNNGNHEYIDIGKFQMFWFTLAAWVGYIWLLLDWEVVANAEGVYVLPELTSGLVVFIGISHAGYLTIKGVQD